MKKPIAEFDDLSDLQHREEQLGCICGRHRSQREHEYEARRMLQCVPVAKEPPRFDGLLAGEAMRVNFPKG
jgi:hypothetical protein